MADKPKGPRPNKRLRRGIDYTAGSLPVAVEKKSGRPKIEINWKRVEDLAFAHCTEVEIAGVLDCSTQTLRNRCREDHGMEIGDFLAIHRAKGKAGLRIAQMKLALGTDKRAPNFTMLLWLGKQYLGQADSAKDLKPNEREGFIRNLADLKRNLLDNQPGEKLGDFANEPAKETVKHG